MIHKTPQIPQAIKTCPYHAPDPPDDAELGGGVAGPDDGGEERGGGLHGQPAVVGCEAGEAARQLGQLRHRHRGQVQPGHLQRVGTAGPGG